MALSIATNTAALHASAVTSSVNRDMETSMARLSTGKRINSAADDAAGVAIASRLTSEIRGTDQAIRNALDGQAVIDTAEGGHKEIENILQRMREVSVQAVNDTNSQADRANMQKEMTALSTEIDRIASVTTWAGQSVMSATTTTFSFQVGTATGGPNQISTTIGSMSTEALMSVSGPGGFVINGAAAGDKSGYSVSGAGDVNGDGLADLIVGSHLANGGRGVTSVVFGKADGTAVDLSAVGTGGFVITNTSGATTDFTGWTVSDAGDVNGDGLADLIVGSGTNAADTTTRESTVVFGKADSTAVDLAAIGTGGFVITGAAAGDRSGYSVSGAGDVNGDGLADLIVGAKNGNPGGTKAAAGESTVVFGKVDSTAVNLAAIGTGGFVINGAVAGDASGISVSGAGDVNGDGLADLIVGAYHARSPSGVSRAGASTVVFGKADSTAVEMSNVGTGGFVINGIADNDRSGISVSGAGDVNGDGLADLIVGAYGAHSFKGESTVVFGKADGTAVDLANVGTGGFVITNTGGLVDDTAGRSVSGAGDVNGDGLADLIVGAPANGAGESTVVFGKADSTAVELSNVGHYGFVINGNAAGSNTLSGYSVSDAGDVNGDGFADLIVGAYGANSNRGETSVVFGKADSTTVELSAIVSGAIQSRKLPVLVTSGVAAKASIGRVDAAIKTVNTQRAELGAVSNRLGHTVNNLTSISTNLSSARGGIEDADFALETTQLAKNQILQQASTAMLAQANASKQNVLSLLQ